MTALSLQTPHSGPSSHRPQIINSTRSSSASTPASHLPTQYSQEARKQGPSQFREPSSGNHAMPSTDYSNGNSSDAGRSPAHVWAPQNGSSNHDTDPSSSRRPSSAPGANDNPVGFLHRSATHANDQRPSQRTAKPALLRSKSEYAALRNDEEDYTDEERREWGARHGFEGHYQSEDIISQLANVG